MDNDSGLPKYAELPRLGTVDARHSWKVFPTDDNLGTLNLLTPQRITLASAEIRTGARFPLQLPAELPDPPFYGRQPARHTIFPTGRNNWDDRLDAYHPQSSTQWDGFRHVRFREFGFYGGHVADPPDLGDRLGVHHWNRGVIGRGVLLDARRWLDEQGTGTSPLEGRSLSAVDLCRIADYQDVQVRPGDVLCVRTGWTGAYRALDADARARLAAGGRPDATGLAGDEAMAERLWDWHIAAVAADNPAVEVSPGDPRAGSLHRRALAALGIPLGELFDFDDLAAACAADNRWSFFFVSVPLAIRGGVGSPGAPVAVR